jgi:hypothetical protein
MHPRLYRKRFLVMSPDREANSARKGRFHVRKSGDVAGKTRSRSFPKVEKITKSYFDN